ncbi:protein EcsC [Thioclava sp. SK-1]|uniref:EcsC family protein n=1 Tax=Thioclava sp. SK-1 TaxID=1889770 RepID=UPI00082525D1|nr:EcsC family protein [Thioclava sp. SK-1]OCX65925.1 protein EcsC [Thioclava sp. SK-1]
MQTDILEPLKDPMLLARLDALAARHRAASGPGMQLLNRVGGSAENLMAKFPGPLRDGLDGATARALEIAFDAAERSRGVVDDRSDWVNRALTTAMGAAGGFGGLAGATAELPFTVTMLLRSIQAIAAGHGFDPASDAVKLECLRILASAGPLKDDDGADLALIAARVTLTGPSLHGMIAKVAPRLAAVLGQKLAAQAAPVLGAVAGAAVNYAFTNYYQEIAHVHFGLKQLAQDSGADEGHLREELVTRITALQ